MKRIGWITLNSLLAGAAAGALVLNLTFVLGQRGGDRPRGASHQTEDGGPANRAAADERTAAASPRVTPAEAASRSEGAAGKSPATVARALGWGRPQPVTAEPFAAETAGPKSAAARQAPWLRYVGSITESDGVAYHYFKDERSGGMLRGAEGREVDGWILSVEGDGSCLLEKGGECLIVKESR